MFPTQLLPSWWTVWWISSGIIKEYEYKFAQLHLHWGDDFRGGSEHTINGRRYFGEVHIVHYEDEYDNLGEALEDAKGDGVAVLGYFIDVRFVLRLARGFGPWKPGILSWISRNFKILILSDFESI